MKTKLLITSLSLMATSAYAQPSIPPVGMPPPTVRAEMPREAAPSTPQPAMQRPMPQMNQSGPQPAVGATGGNEHLLSPPPPPEHNQTTPILTLPILTVDPN